MVDGFAAFAAYFIATAALLRLGRRSPAAAVTGAALALYPIGLVGSLGVNGRVEFWTYSTTYWFLALSYLMAFGAIFKSVSLRLMLDVLEAPNGQARRADIFTRYIGDRSYHDRLDVARKNELARETPDGFLLTERGRTIARSVAIIQRLFSIRASG